MAAQLGYVDSWRPSSSVVATPYDSRLGGLPAFYGAAPPQPVCSKCSIPLLLVLQLYAPTDMDRTLYVFACNSTSCNRWDGSRQHRGDWQVLRAQTAAVQTSGLTEAPPVSSAAKLDDWGASTDWTTEGTAWGTGNDEAATADLPAPVAAPDVKHATVDSDVTVTGPPPGWDCSVHFPPYGLIVDEVDEAYASSSDSSDDDKPAARRRTCDTRADAHAKMLFDKYSSWEASAEALEDSTTAAAGAAGSSSDGSDVDYEPEEHPKSAKKAKHVPGGDKRKGGRKAKAAGEDDGPEKYEKVPAKLRFMLRFQDYLKLNGNPCIRYAYGLAPIWPCAPKLRPSTPPRCVCGARRVFEAQIFATVLTGLDTTSMIAKETSAAGPASSTVEDLLKQGLDFLTVLIYSCEDSCETGPHEHCEVLQTQ